MGTVGEKRDFGKAHRRLQDDTPPIAVRDL